MTNRLPWKDPPFLIGKPSINGPLSMAMLNNQRVIESTIGVIVTGNGEISWLT